VYVSVTRTPIPAKCSATGLLKALQAVLDNHNNHNALRNFDE